MNTSRIQVERWSGPPGGAASPLVLFVSRVIEGNYFYVFSAVLMMLGCYLLMHSPVIKGAEFSRTLKTLLILQAYEILLIVTAVIIVRRLKVLDDAFTLLVLELVLLLDPTFFSNSFFTMRSIESAGVNVACFALVPVKLYILQRALHLRLSPGMFGGFLVACAVVFLAEGPLNLEHPPLSRNTYYYLLGWMPLVVALLLPPMKRMIRVESETAYYMTDGQRVLLGRCLMLLPVGIMTAHFIETSFVYSLHFYSMYVVPLVLAVAVLMINNTERTEPKEVLSKLCVTIDVLAVIALVLSVGFRTVDSKISLVSRVTAPPPEFIDGSFRIVVGVAAILALYCYFYLRLSHRPALYRIGAILAVGCGYFLIRVSWPAITVAAIGMRDFIVMTATALPNYLWEHLAKPGILVWAALVVLAARHKATWTRLLLAAGSICWFFTILPGAVYSSMPELPECIGVVALVCDHLFWSPKNRSRRQLLALAIVAIGIVRFCHTPTLWSFGIVAGETVGLIAAGLLLKHPGYVVIGLLAGGVLAIVGVREARIQIPPAVFTVAGGLTLFAVGVFVTFNKLRILNWLQCATGPVSGVNEQTPQGDYSVRESPPKPGGVSFAEGAEEETEIEPNVEMRPMIIEKLEDLFRTDLTSGIFKAADLSAQTRNEIVLSLELAAGEELAVCIARPSAMGDWLALMTSDRVIAKRGIGKKAISIGYDQIANVSTTIFQSLVLTDHAGRAFKLRNITGVQAGSMKMALDVIRKAPRASSP